MRIIFSVYRTFGNIERVLFANFSCGIRGLSLVTIIVPTLQSTMLGLRKVNIQGC